MIKKIPAVLAVTSSLATPLVALAQSAPQDACGVIRLFQSFAGYFATVVFILSVLTLLYAAFLFITGSGSEEGTTKAKTFLIYALIGIAVGLLAQNGVAIVKSITGSATVTQCGIGF